MTRLLPVALGRAARRRRGARSGAARARLRRRRRRLRPEGERQHRRRGGRRRLRAVRLGPAPDPQRRRRGPGAALPREPRLRRDPRRRRQGRQRQRRDRRAAGCATPSRSSGRRPRNSTSIPPSSRSRATGKIGEALPMEKVLDGVRRAAAAVRPDGGAEFAEAIMTTDRGPKRCTVQLRRGHGLGPGEGRRDDPAGLRDDALLRPDRRRPRRPLRRRGGAARGGRPLLRADHGRRPDEHQRHGAAPGERRVRPAAAAGPARRRTAAARARDRRRRRGRDAGRLRAGHEARPAQEEAERAARAIANSPLVKTALFGHDPNWGRIAQAAGHGARRRGGRGARRSTTSTPTSSPARGRRPSVSLRLGRGDHAAHVWFSDLGYEYVRINAEYTT